MQLDRLAARVAKIRNDRLRSKALDSVRRIPAGARVAATGSFGSAYHLLAVHGGETGVRALVRLAREGVRCIARDGKGWRR